MDIQIDFQSGIPLFEQIAYQILSLIEKGQLSAGDQLPTIRKLAVELGINFNTVARAYRLLDQRTVISTQQGRGTYILPEKKRGRPKKNPPETIEKLTRFYIRKAKHLGFNPDEIRVFFEKINSEGKDR